LSQVNHQSTNLVIRLATALVIILSFWFVFSELNSNNVDFLAAMKGADANVILGFFFVATVLCLGPLIWLVMMQGSGAQISLRASYAIWWSTNIAKYVPGKVSLIAGRAWVARRWGSKVVIESFAWEVIISTSSALIASCLLLPFGELSLEVRILLGISAVVSLFPLISPKLTQELVRKPLRLLGRGEWETETTMSRKHYSAALLLMIISWLLWGLAHKFILIGLGYNASITLLIGSFAIAWLIGFFAFFLPAGLGAREGVFTYILSLFLVGGIGAILSIVSRTVNVLVEVVFFMIGMVMMKSLKLAEEE